MSSLRKYGPPPHAVAVIHGGPGAPGAVSLLAEALGKDRGVIEPFQTADSVSGQIAELAETLERHAVTPSVLIGSSWGAWLALLTAARHPALVRKLILVGCPALEDWFARDVTALRLRRLGDMERQEARALIQTMIRPDAPVADKDLALARIGVLYAKADSVDPVTLDMGVRGASFRIHSAVWREATRLRARGELTSVGRHIRCPVVAFHGDRDPHPAEGVEGPLRGVLRDFRFVLLRDCGHFPWIERGACDGFLRALEAEL